MPDRHREGVEGEDARGDGIGALHDFIDKPSVRKEITKPHPLVEPHVRSKAPGVTGKLPEEV
jgi:hypothetical protein